MFGYVKPYVPELKVVENSYYRASYCGLCRAMRDETGVPSRFMLNYDFTFLVLARLAVTGEIPEFEKKRCFVHPLRKKLVMKPNDALRFSADMCALLSYHKFGDTIEDEKGLKRLGARVLKLVFGSAYRRAKKKFAEADKVCAEKLALLSKIEKERVKSADKPSGVFGEMMGELFSLGIADAASAKIAHEIGFLVGKWIYVIDAIDDIESDGKKGNYNPFLLLFDGREPSREIKLDIKGAALALTKKAENAFDLVSFGDRRDLCGLIHNILSLGMPRTLDAVLFSGETENETEITDDRPL